MPGLRVLVGSLAPGALPEARSDRVPDGTVLLDLGDDHPSRAGLLELRLWVEAGDAGDVVTSADPVVGALHRGAEKLYEVRDYRQILMLADRHDWQAPFSNELALALAGERLLGLEVPPRAVWLRTLLAERTRIASHLGHLGWLARRLEAPSLAPLREEFRRSLQALTGNRVHPMVTVLGGLATHLNEAADPAWLDAEVALADRAAGAVTALEPTEDLVGVAPVSTAQVDGYGLSGPLARASGVDLDLRRSQPYLAYAELAGLLPGPGPTRPSGDAAARFGVLAAEVTTSARLVRACAERLADLDGPVDVPLPKVLKLPEGEVALVTEAPLGWAGCWLVSRGEKTPWRLKLRTPSFSHVAALAAILPGVPVASLEAALASIGYVVGDLDK